MYVSKLKSAVCITLGKFSCYKLQATNFFSITFLIKKKNKKANNLDSFKPAKKIFS